MICGIYGIKNKINGKIYVGQSVNIKTRQRQHLSELRQNKHFNQHLQNSWNKYKEENFEFVILEECKEDKLNLKEYYWIKNQKSVYNIEVDSLVEGRLSKETIQKMLIAQSGSNNSFFGKKHSKSTKLKMSEFAKTRIGNKNSNFGRKNSIESKIKMSEGRGKLNKKKVLEITKLLKQGIEHIVIAEKFNVCRTAITKISSGARWTNVTGGPIIPVIYENGKRKISENHRKNKSKIYEV